MKIYAMLLLPLLGVGCGVELLTTAAIVGELHKQSAVAAVGQLHSATDTMNHTRVQGAINYYYGEKGYYPSTLFELVPDFIEELALQPDGTVFNYDPNTGKLLEGPGMTPPTTHVVTSGERYRMKKIEDAINEYGYATGFYPSTLEDLVPMYLPSVPLTDGGRQFIYYTADGGLFHPYDLETAAAPIAPRGTNTARQRSPRIGATGGGPLGEAMTSIAIHNQLGNMNSTGANRARSTAGSSLGRTQNNYNRQQEKALKDLGY